MTLTEPTLARALTARADWIDLPDDLLTRIKAQAAGAPRRRRAARPWLWPAAAALLLLPVVAWQLHAPIPGESPSPTSSHTTLLPNPPVDMQVQGGKGIVGVVVTPYTVDSIRRLAPFFDQAAPEAWRLSKTVAGYRVDGTFPDDRMPLIHAEYRNPNTYQSLRVEQWVSTRQAPQAIPVGTTETTVNGYRTWLIKDLVLDKNGKPLPTFSPRVLMTVTLSPDRTLWAEFTPVAGEGAMTLDDLLAVATAYTQKPPTQSD